MSGDRAGASDQTRGRRAVLLLSLVALAGAVLGAGLAIAANVSGAILAAYGLVLGLLVGGVVVAARRARARPREDASAARPADPPRSDRDGSGGGTPGVRGGKRS